MASKMKPHEVRSLLVASGNVQPSNSSISQVRLKDKKASMEAAIAQRKLECKKQENKAS